MNRLLEDLVKVLTLERLELNMFRGESRDIGSPQVFGGQVLGQALSAASATVEDRMAHSLHAYFLRRGDFNSPIVYEVDRARDGKHFSTRRIVAIQHGEQIFNMSASFQSDESGLEHQSQMPDVPPPEQLMDLEAFCREHLSGAPVNVKRRSTCPGRSCLRARTSGSGPSMRCRTTNPCTAACSPTCRTSTCWKRH